MNKKSAYFIEKLSEALPSHKVVGSGLLLGIVCEEEVASYIPAADEAGLLLVSAGPNVIRLLPPLTVTTEEIDQAVDILKTILS